MSVEQAGADQLHNNETGKSLEIVDVVDGKRQGQYLRYYPDGFLEMSCFYTDDLLDGLQTIYYPGGNKIRITTTYKRGKKVGATTEYYDSGIISSITIYDENEVSREVKLYYPSGKLYGHCQYELADTRQAVSVFYDENGTMRERISRSNNKFTNLKCEYFDEYGRLEKTMQYVDGVLLEPAG